MTEDEIVRWRARASLARAALSEAIGALVEGQDEAAGGIHAAMKFLVEGDAADDVLARCAMLEQENARLSGELLEALSALVEARDAMLTEGHNA